MRLAAAGRPIDKDSTVTVTLVSPTVSAGDIITKHPVEKLPASEPGLSLAQRQLLALTQDARRLAAFKTTQERLTLKSNEKGEFRTQIKPSVPGVYTAFVMIDGDVRGLGQFSRTQTLTTVVRFANADPRLSKIFRTDGIGDDTETRALDGVTIDIDRGEYASVAGPS